MSLVKEWHCLFKDGVITEEYEQQKKKILGDVGELRIFTYTQYIHNTMIMIVHTLKFYT